MEFFGFIILEPGNVSTMNAAARKEEELRVQRAAEREGRRTRRRRGKPFLKFIVDVIDLLITYTLSVKYSRS